MPPTRRGVPGVWPPGGCHVRFFFRFSLPFRARVVLRARGAARAPFRVGVGLAGRASR